MSIAKFFLSILFFCCICFSCEAAVTEDEVLIREKEKAYEAAYNRKDAKALSMLWSEDAEYVNPETDVIVKGREEIEKEFAQVFKDREEDAKIEITIKEITFPKNNEAVETGVAKVITSSGELIDQTAYKVIYVKQNGEWLISQAREIESFDPPTQYEHLKDLEWLIGTWIDEDEDAVIKTEFQWDKYKNFLTQHFTITVEGTQELEGKQLIAWDPINERIRSWVFDSDGGFGEGVWKKKENTWVVELSQTLADGRKASSVNLYTPINADSYTWESTGREVDGDLLPNIDPVTVVRQKERTI